jgi:hypothetical protein
LLTKANERPGERRVGERRVGKRKKPDRTVSFAEAKTLIKANQWKKWKQEHPNYNAMDGYHLLTRREQVIIFRLRTGHNRLN